MTIKFIKDPDPRWPSISRYEIRAYLFISEKEDRGLYVPLGHVEKSHWGRGPHDGIRWEFKHPHPLKNFYPDTLADAKELVSTWAVTLITNGLTQEIGRGRCNHLPIPESAI